MLRRSVISLILVLVAISGWGRTRPHYGGTLRVEIGGDGITSPDATFLHLVLDGLTRSASDGALQPGLATDWKSSNGDRQWVFTVRDGVTFHNGFPLTADRAAASLIEDCNRECPWSSLKAQGNAIVISSDVSMPELPWLLAEDRFLISLTDAGEGKEPPCCIGTGPFQLTNRHYPAITFIANESYWAGRPYADTVELVTGRSIREQWFDLSVGRADIVEVPPEEIRLAQQQHMTLLASSPVDLLALEISTNGALANPSLRAAISLAIDRAALFNVIFQKQGEIAASILPQELSGYAFLFPAERDLAKAQELRGGVKPPVLSLGFQGAGSMQLAAQRIALNLREAGFDVQVTSASHADLMLRSIPLASTNPAAALESVLRALGETTPPAVTSPTAIYRAEHDFLDRKTLMPLLDLPRAYAAGSHVRDLTLGSDGTPGFADAWLEAAP
ncbi:MAG: ABC transporter substrate-binding protein [Terracidiphilus sp.]